MPKDIILSDVLISKIHNIRGYNVMLDSDLAELYQVESKRLNEQVKRNIERFPEDFMFQLTENEWNNLMSQIATTKSWNKRRTLPYVFTEHGVAMLSSVLRSDIAINVNIQIIRLFTKMRENLSINKDILLKLNDIESKVNEHDTEIKTVFKYLQQFIKNNDDPIAPIGFKYDE